MCCCKYIRKVFIKYRKCRKGWILSKRKPVKFDVVKMRTEYGRFFVIFGHKLGNLTDFRLKFGNSWYV